MAGKTSSLGDLLQLFEIFSPPSAALLALLPGSLRLIRLEEAAAAGMALRLYQQCPGRQAERSRRLTCITSAHQFEESCL